MRSAPRNVRIKAYMFNNYPALKSKKRRTKIIFGVKIK